MKKQSFLYKNPLIYQWALMLNHNFLMNNSSTYQNRYKYIASEIEHWETVFEPGAGIGTIAKYLYSSEKYRGEDRNEKFVNYAQKKGINIKLGDARNLNTFPKQVNTIVLIDFYTHLGIEEDKQQVLETCLKIHPDKLIICDPFKDKYLEFFKKFPFLPKKLPTKWYKYAEQDGFNNITLDDVRTKDKLQKEMEEGLGIIHSNVNRKIKEIGEDLIVTYTF